MLVLVRGEGGLPGPFEKDELQGRAGDAEIDACDGGGGADDVDGEGGGDDDGASACKIVSERKSGCMNSEADGIIQ